ncbi:hypothetical protein C1I95_03350 [Micromonospora craterilacus]|uniref:Streptomyces killer toxin-like beta/gamma crystallin domain-containing protein n=2 Tax=Micromonospora craterilacus TaxID=1655439 RepID=A0A2W2FFD6_9ACTN|nr:hypothetical protein C1I95_03350 [Micromonospora craterilacus]
MATMFTLAAITAATLVTTASPAAATASGCTAARDIGLVCGEVIGSGLHISTATVTRTRPGWPVSGNVCDYQGLITVYNSSGSQIYQQRSPKHSGCTFYIGWFDFNVNRYFPNNSKISLSFYEYGVHQGTVSFKITT